MHIWAIADLHLPFGNPSKSMEKFGLIWKDYTDKIEKNWKNHISDEDLVLIAGDVSWAVKLQDAMKDLLWIDKLPGKKILIRGNHDYFWSSKKKLKERLPPSISIIQNDAINIDNISITGTRFWDSDEYNFDKYIEITPNTTLPPINQEEQRKIFNREFERLKICLAKLNPRADMKIVLTHYPPISADLKDSKTSLLLEEHGINHCIFGHLHSLKTDSSKIFGERNGISYHLTSSDYLNFTPKKIL